MGLRGPSQKIDGEGSHLISTIGGEAEPDISPNPCPLEHSAAEARWSDIGDSRLLIMDGVGGY